MLKGKRQYIDHTSYFSPHFRRPRYKLTPDVRGSCGTYAVSVLLGKKPKDCIELLGREKYWNDLRMIRMLRKRGYVVTPLTINGICGTSVHDTRKVKMNGMHVILCSQHAYSDEATYSVFYDGLQYHSGDISPITPMELINYPIWTCFVVWHPKWAPRSKLEAHICRVYGNLELSIIEKLREKNHMGFQELRKAMIEKKNKERRIMKKIRENMRKHGKPFFDGLKLVKPRKRPNQGQGRIQSR